MPCRKLGPKYIGPFPIVRVINPVTVQICLPWLLGKIHLVFHCSLLHLTQAAQIRGPPAKSPPPIMVGDQHFKVKEILDTRWHRGWLQYLVLWKAYPLSEASWVPSHDVRVPWLVARFHWQHPVKPGGLNREATHCSFCVPGAVPVVGGPHVSISVLAHPAAWGCHSGRDDDGEHSMSSDGPTRGEYEPQPPVGLQDSCNQSPAQ